MIKVSYAQTVYGQEEIDAVVSCLKTSTQMGNKASTFEKLIAELFVKKHGLFVNSGSSALYLGMEASSLSKGSEVITPALTFSTTVGCIIKNNLTPVFVDVGEADYCISTDQIESMITNNTKAILAPNLMGNLCDWKTIREIADKYNLMVIEDSADTLGGKINGELAGKYSDWAITSFYGSHIINCAGNGGMLCINDDEIYKKAKLLRSWGRSSSVFDEKSEEIENRFNVQIDDIDYDAKFIFEEIGYNLEGSEIGASFGLVQLKKLEQNIQIRKDNFATQTKFFNKYPELFTTPKIFDNVDSAWLAYPIIINDKVKFSRRDFQIHLEKNNIQTRTVFTGNITRQPGFNKIKMRKLEKLPNSDRIMENAVLLACHHGLTEEMISHMHNTIDDFISKNA
tara:strand:+ start:8345 stop:9538 length:1194 start_codon:yes stop_codon:yes gene_type:complete